VSRPAPAEAGPHRVLVTGSRTWTDRVAIATALRELRAHHGARLVIVHGGCLRGADALADEWCRIAGVPVERHPADWHTHGRRAGYLRNAAMVGTAPAQCLAFIRNHSAGASHCAALAVAHGIPTRYYRREDA
jgi:hypothetical protein